MAQRAGSADLPLHGGLGRRMRTGPADHCLRLA